MSYTIPVKGCFSDCYLKWVKQSLLYMITTVILQLWHLSESPNSYQNWVKFQRLSHVLLQQAWSFLGFISSPSDSESQKDWEPLGYIIFAAVTQNTCLSNPDNQSKLCFLSIVKRIKLKFLWGHRTFHSLGLGESIIRNSISTLHNSWNFHCSPNPIKHMLQLHLLFYYSQNLANAIGSLLCKYDSLILENRFCTFLPRKSYSSFKICLKKSFPFS